MAIVQETLVQVRLPPTYICYCSSAC